MANARLVLTDSGGIQEETTILGVPFGMLRAGPSACSGQALRHAQGRPCLTLCENTERPVTVTQGTNAVVGRDSKRIVREALAILDGKSKAGCVPELWDGRAAERVLNVLVEMVEQQGQSVSVAGAHEWCQEVDHGNDA